MRTQSEAAPASLSGQKAGQQPPSRAAEGRVAGRRHQGHEETFGDDRFTDITFTVYALNNSAVPFLYQFYLNKVVFKKYSVSFKQHFVDFFFSLLSSFAIIVYPLTF